MSVHSKLHRPLKKFCPSDPFAQTPAPLCLIFKAGHILMGGGDLTLCCFQKMHQSSNLGVFQEAILHQNEHFSHFMKRWVWLVGWLGWGDPPPHWRVSFAALHFIQCLCVGPFVSGQCSKVSFAVLPSILVSGQCFWQLWTLFAGCLHYPPYIASPGLWTVSLAVLGCACLLLPSPTESM